MQEAWTLKIGSDEPEMCWGCVGGRGLFVVSKRGSQQSIEQLNGSGIFEVSSPHESSSREIWFRRAIRPTPYHTKCGLSSRLQRTKMIDFHFLQPGQGASASPRRPSHTLHPSNLGPPRLHFKHNIHGTLHHDRRPDPPDACRHPIPIGLPQNLNQ